MFENVPLPDRLDDATEPARCVASFSKDGAARPLRVNEGVVKASVGTGVPSSEAALRGEEGGESWRLRSRSRDHS